MPELLKPSQATLRAELDSASASLANAESPEQYQNIFERAQTVAQTAMDIQSSELAFYGGTLAARAAFALAQNSKATNRDAWLRHSYEALLNTTKKVANTLPAELLITFSILLCDIFEESRSHAWLGEERTQAERLLRQLARAVEIIVPIELVDPQSAKRTSELAHILANFSYQYGTQNVADARSDFAITTAEQAQALQAWIDAVYSRYIQMKDNTESRRGSLNQATSLEDLDVWLKDLEQPNRQQDQRAALIEQRAILRSLAERFRMSFRSRTGRLWAVQHLAPMLSECFFDELAEHELEGVLLEIIDSFKARLLLDYITITFHEIKSPEAAAKAVEIEKQILQFESESVLDANDLLAHEMILTSQLPIGYFVDDVFEPQRKIQRQLLVDALEERYAQHGAGFTDRKAPLSYNQISEALKPDEALIEYFLPPTRESPGQQQIFIFVVTREQVYLQQSRLEGEFTFGSASADGKQPRDVSGVAGEVLELRLAIQRGDDVSAHLYLQMFYKLLVAPILDLGLYPQNFRRWIIVPHAALHSIPFAALRSQEGRYLIEDVAMTIVPSAAVWYTLQDHAPSPVTSFIGFANPLLLNAKWPPLPQTEEEIKHICESLNRLQCTKLVAEEATEENLRQEAPDKNIIHFATHGDFPENDVIDLHRILLAPTAESDGLVHAEELRRMNLQAARLITLSICNGGLYRIGPGDEPYGLIPALLTAGAENVFGTLWPVEDQAGRAFMIEFYNHVLKQGPAEAWRRAYIRFLKDGMPLRDVANWVLVGTGRTW